MRLADNVRLALERLRHRPVRSLLLLQGTIWGVAVSLFPTAVIEGTRDAIARDGASVGADRISIALDPTGVDPKPLTTADVAAVREALAEDGTPVVALAGVALRMPSSSVRDSGVPSAVLVGPSDAFEARSLVLAEGRRADPAAPAPEAVVEGVLADEIRRANGRVLGETIPSLDGLEATVVGALAPRTPLARRTNDMGFDTEHPVFRGVTGKLLINLGVPFGDDEWKRSDRAAWVAGDVPAVDWVFLRVPVERVRQGALVANRALASRGRTTVTLRPFVYALLLHRDVDRFTGVSRALFLACLAMSAVVMASVGLLAAVKRAPEIAVHRVEGATRRDVMLQFLVEGFVLSVLGVIVGWGLGCGLAEIRIALEPMAGMTWAFPWGYAAATLVVSVVVGCLASLLPALRAALRDPVESLADE